jgi:hypothetical protein
LYENIIYAANFWHVQWNLDILTVLQTAFYSSRPSKELKSNTKLSDSFVEKERITIGERTRLVKDEEMTA